jgi:hypothetical protein
MNVMPLEGVSQCEFRLRLAADPGPSGQFEPWHLADRVALPGASEPMAASSHNAFAIRYRVL